MSLEQVSRNATFGGHIIKYKVTSVELGGLDATFNVFLPKESSTGNVPQVILIPDSLPNLHPLIPLSPIYF